MYKLQGRRIYLAALEREHCRKLFEDWEYDFECVAEPMFIGQSLESADVWYEEIQKQVASGNTIRLGIFLNDGTPIGAIGLQDINWRNRNCSLGMDIVKLSNRSQGYGKEACRLMLDYAFCNLGLERVSAGTNATNIGGQKSLEGVGFVLEGRYRRDVWVAGQYVDSLRYAILRDEWKKNAE